MFYSLTGKIQKKLPNAVVLEVGGVGFLVYTIIPILAKINVGESIKVFTYFHVREDHLDLVGFVDEASLDVFKKIVSVSGIGIKGALAVLSANSCDEIIKAIEKSDSSLFQKISGIGKKTAQKIILELKGKVDFDQEDKTSVVDQEAEDALMRLGFTKKEARQALGKIDSKITKLEDKIKEVLKNT